ncbi:MAG: PAS domain-containing sensor histidine kinase [Bacillota bacterium]|nr:PAS domain-containing sensor histidine kinase [Bacillota bacterium]
MYLIPGYSMLASTATTLMLSIIFLILSHQSGKRYMRLWGASWLVYSVMFLLDFLNLSLALLEVSYVMLRQIISLIGSYLFLFGTYHFFQRKFPGYLRAATLVSTLLIVLYPTSEQIYAISLIPNAIYCSGLLIVAGCMFIAFSWTQKLPEKLLASFFIILWSIFVNHFGFALGNSAVAMYAYFIGLLTVNVLILILIIVYFKKLRFLDTKRSARFRLLVENSSDSMFLYDYKRQNFEYISPAISQLIGLSPEQLYKMPDRFFDYIEVEKKHSDIIGIFSRPVSTPGNSVLCFYKDGAVLKWSEIHYMPIRDNTGTVVAVEGILRDITERKKMEEGLRQAEKTKKELLENISHEIKTPVTLIQGYTESLLDKVVPAESADTYLKMINSKAMMLTTLLNDLSQVSNVTSQSLEYRFYESPAAEVFGDLMRECEFHINSSDHKAVIASSISDKAVLIVDPYRIQQVVSNMINNAIRHTPLAGEIYVSCSTYVNEELLHTAFREDHHNVPEGELLFTVSDTGDGIAEKDLARIFERNFSEGKKLNTSEASEYTVEYNGVKASAISARSGLGLHISKQIIAQHSGKMFAKNNKYGGAEISFTLPYYT